MLNAKKVAETVAFNVLVPEGLIPEIDELVAEGQYNGRGDLALTLIRKYIDDRRHENVVAHEYELHKYQCAKEKKRKQNEDQ